MAQRCVTPWRTPGSASDPCASRHKQAHLPRQVTKKHDKYCGGSAGSRFLQACWDAGHLQWGGFLHSPLMVGASFAALPEHARAAATVGTEENVTGSS